MSAAPTINSSEMNSDLERTRAMAYCYNMEVKHENCVFLQQAIEYSTLYVFGAGEFTGSNFRR